MILDLIDFKTGYAILACVKKINVFPNAALVQTLVTYHHEVASIPHVEVSRESCTVSA